jgi:hypothetical protein
MSRGRLRSRPPRSGSVEDFISGADTGEKKFFKASDLNTKTYPWQVPGVRDDISKVYNLRLPEPYLLKLKYISEHTPDSMQKFCIDVILPAIDAKIQELTGDPDKVP